MKSIYRGFEIEARREQCLAGYDMAYYTAVRQSDGYEMIASFTEGRDPLREIIKGIKADIDDYYKHPENWEDEF